MAMNGPTMKPVQIAKLINPGYFLRSFKLTRSLMFPIGKLILPPPLRANPDRRLPAMKKAIDATHTGFRPAMSDIRR